MQLSDSFSRVRRAASVALDRTTKITGGEGDEDLRIYKALTPAMFDKLVEKYGPEEVIRYICYMEAKRMRHA